MEENTYRRNRIDFYEKFLDFEFVETDAEQFFVNWREIISQNLKGDYSPYAERNDLFYLFEMTGGDGDMANEYLQELLLEKKSINDETWTEFISKTAEM